MPSRAPISKRTTPNTCAPTTASSSSSATSRPKPALALVERTLGDWRVEGAPPAFAIPDAPQPTGVTDVAHFIAGKTQNDLILGFPGIRRDNPDYYALEMMNLILGRLGLYGRLGKSVREDQGLAYYAISGLEAGFGPGPWSVRAGVNPSNVRRAVRSILAEIERIRASRSARRNWPPASAS